MKSRHIAILSLFILTIILVSSAHALSFSPNSDEPVLTLRRQANLREEGIRSGTLFELYPDQSLEISALGLLSDADEPVLIHSGSVTDEEYAAVDHLLTDGDFLSMPEWIETGVLDGDTLALTARTPDGTHTVSAYSPDGTPFGEIINELENILGAYENTEGE